MMRKIGSIAFGIALMLVLGGCDAKQKAKEELEQKGITYSQESFAKSVVSNNKDVVELFFKAGIDLNTPEILEALVNSDDMGIIKKALESGLNSNAKANGVPLIVMLVVDKKNNPKLKDLLEDKNLNINLQVEKTYKDFLETGNALLLSAVKNNLGAFEMLIKKGADTKMTYTLLGKSKLNIAGWLLMNPETSEADILNMLKMIPNLDINSKVSVDKGEMNLLHLASGQHKVEIVKFLVDKGANVNAVMAPTKMTSLIAVYRGQTNVDTEKAEIIEKLLISKGANKSLKDADGNTFQYYKDSVIGKTIKGVYMGDICGDLCYMDFKTANGKIVTLTGSQDYWKLTIGKSYTVTHKMQDVEIPDLGKMTVDGIINIK